MTAITLERETNSYWNLIKDSGNEVKIALIQKLAEALVPIVPASKEERQTITPAMRRQINRARKEYATGQTITCRTPQEMQQYFDSL